MVRIFPRELGVVFTFDAPYFVPAFDVNGLPRDCKMVDVLAWFAQIHYNKIVKGRSFASLNDLRHAICERRSSMFAGVLQGNTLSATYKGHMLLPSDFIRPRPQPYRINANDGWIAIVSG